MSQLKSLIDCKELRQALSRVMYFQAHRKWVLLITFCLFGALLPKAQALVLCVENEPFLPLTNANFNPPGHAQVLLATAAKNINMPLKIEFVPWRRCRALVATGKYEAMLCAAYSGLNPNISEFPMLNPGIPDASRAVGTVKTYLYRRKASMIDYANGKFISSKKPIVGIIYGYQSHMDAVVNGGGLYDDSAHSAAQHLKMLLYNRVDLVAGEYAFATLVNAQYQDRLESLPTPLLEANYFLAFSKQFYATNQEKAQQLWNEIAKIRKSPTYKASIQNPSKKGSSVNHQKLP